MADTVLVTGGAGYIGSHTTVELLKAGHDVVVVDNLSNASPLALKAVAGLAGRPVRELVVADITDRTALDDLFRRHRIDAVVHFAALKAIGESMAEPLKYYQNNVGGLLSLLGAMDRHEVHRLVFSSSCTVYGVPSQVPITEKFPRRGANPYGRTKLTCEDVLNDVAAAEPDWRVSLLRY